MTFSLPRSSVLLGLTLLCACGSGSSPITVQVAAPTFSPAGGSSVASGSAVTLSDATAGATICFTTDGSTPAATDPGACSHGTAYTAPVAITADTTFRAIGTLAGSTNSAVVAASYTIALPGTVAAPTFSPASGSSVASGSTITLSDATGGATICFTTDGSAPAATDPGACSHGTAYTAPVAITADTTFRALGTLAGSTNSAVVAASYTIAAGGGGTVESHGFVGLASGGTLVWPWAFGDSMGVKDNGGNGELLVFGWNGTRFAAVKSADHGASWTAVNPAVTLGEASGTDVNGWGPKSVIQTSDGKIHILSVQNGGIWHYSRVTLVRAAGAVTGYTVDLNLVPLSTPDGPYEYRGHLVAVRDGAGHERIAFVYHDSTGGLDARSRVQVTTVAAGTSPSSASDFQTIGGAAISGTDDIVYDTTITGMDAQNWGSHCYTSLLAQDGSTKDLYVFLGAVNTLDNPSMSPIKAIRLVASGTTWTVDTSIPAFGHSGSSAPLSLCAARGTDAGVWVAYNDLVHGITIDKLSGGARTPDIVPAPGTPADAFAMCALAVAADESQVFLGWIIDDAAQTNAVYTGGAWQRFALTGNVTGEWGTGGTIGWDTGLTWAALDQDGHMSAASIYAP